MSDLGTDYRKENYCQLIQTDRQSLLSILRVILLASCENDKINVLKVNSMNYHTIIYAERDMM